jgi:Primosomal protein N'' (replication factor Y) - superfamily II helicase
MDDNITSCTSCGSKEFSNICNNCGTIFDSSFCPTCGKKAGELPVVCWKCGNKSFDPFCPKCGSSLNGKNEKKKNISDDDDFNFQGFEKNGHISVHSFHSFDEDGFEDEEFDTEIRDFENHVKHQMKTIQHQVFSQVSDFDDDSSEVNIIKNIAYSNPAQSPNPPKEEKKTVNILLVVFLSFLAFIVICFIALIILGNSSFVKDQYPEDSSITVSPTKDTLSSGNYMASTDFPAGIYDIIASKGRGKVVSFNSTDVGIHENMSKNDNSYSKNFITHI